MIDKLSYAGRRVMVTGAASGIGKATAEMVAGLGADLYALDLHEPSSKLAQFVETDLRDPASIERAAKEVGGPVDALFNCAGIAGTHPPLDILLCNFCGTRHLTEAVLPLMPDGSAIATVSSVAGLRWQQSADLVRALVQTESFDAARRWCERNLETIASAYSFSKCAVTLHAIVTAPKLAPRGIRMNTVSPGSTATSMWQGFLGRASQKDIDNARGVSGRSAAPEEQANALVFLNSAAASYISGADLVVDGGRQASIIAAELGT